jgi:serine/threonine protein kinase
MTHLTTQQLESLLSEGLDPELRVRVEAHVNDCDDCLKRLEALQRSEAPALGTLVELLIRPPATVTVNGDTGGAQPVKPDGVGERPDWPVFPGYELLARVDRGGMAEVYQARQKSTNRTVALKTVSAACRPEERDQQFFLTRLRTEAEAVSRLQHAHIVSIYDVGEQDGRPYFTMEWMDGGCLSDCLAGRPQGEHEAAEWVCVLAQAVDCIHQAGIVHRDLKPANILLSVVGNQGSRVYPPGQPGNWLPTQFAGASPRHDPSSQFGSLATGRQSLIRTDWPRTMVPKVTDFGIAKLLDRQGGMTSATQWLGTPEYMAPEQAADHGEGRPVGPAADVYALGVVLYEFLTGRPPFKAHEPLETLRQVRDEEPLSPRRLRPRLSRDLETIVLKCLQKEPERRYASARDLAEDLQLWLRGCAIHARPSSLAERSLKWAKRHPERAVLGLIVVALLFAAAAGYFWQSWAANADYARQLARSADYQLLLVKYAVSQTAQDGDLRDLLTTPSKGRGEWQTYLDKTKRDFLRWFTRPGENPPIINWFVMDPVGMILADSYEDPRSVGRRYDFRDYYQSLCALDTGPNRTEVYLSKVYESEQDDRYKITATTRVWEGGRMLGILGASLAVDSRMAALDMKREGAGAMVVGPMDHGRRAGSPPPDAPQTDFIVLLHRDYAVPGQKPMIVESDKRKTLARFAIDAAIKEEADHFSQNGSLIDYARVGDSHFIVIVERLYPWPIQAVARRPRLSFLALVGVAICSVLWRWWYQLRLRPSTGA